MILGLTPGELFIVVFVTFAVLSAGVWPRLGEAVFRLFAGSRAESGDSDAER